MQNHDDIPEAVAIFTFIVNDLGLSCATVTFRYLPHSERENAAKIMRVTLCSRYGELM